MTVCGCDGSQGYTEHLAKQGEFCHKCFTRCAAVTFTPLSVYDASCHFRPASRSAYAASRSPSGAELVALASSSGFVRMLPLRRTCKRGRMDLPQKQGLLQCMQPCTKPSQSNAWTIVQIWCMPVCRASSTIEHSGVLARCTQGDSGCGQVQVITCCQHIRP